MRPFFKALPIILLLLVAAGVGIGQILPDERTIARRLTIDAEPAEVFDRVGRIRGWSGWYVAPDAEARFEGPEGSGGALVVVDENTGEERRLVLTETSSPSLAVYAFPQVEAMPFEIEGRFEIRPEGDGRATVRSAQRLRGRAGGIFAQAGGRWFLAVLAPNLIGSILERELHNLKAAVEGRPLPAAPAPPEAQ